LRIGIDLGGTKIEGIAFDCDHNVRWQGRIDTPVDNYNKTLQAIVNLIRHFR